MKKIIISAISGIILISAVVIAVKCKRNKNHENPKFI